MIFSVFACRAFLFLGTYASEVYGESIWRVPTMVRREGDGGQLEASAISSSLHQHRERQRLIADEHHALASKSVAHSDCKLQNTVWDVGMNDAEDTRNYLARGMCVIAVEADPDLVEQAKQNMTKYISSGQLTIVHKAITKNNTHSFLNFWRSKFNNEWNSFDRNVACRGKQSTGPGWTHWQVDLANCYSISVDSIPCGDLLHTYGVPLYMKLDIEGQEKSCLDALGKLSSGSHLPQYLSSEMNSDSPHIQLKQLGYTKFKLVRQDLLLKAHSTSGGWGDLAMDCERRGEWSTFEEFTARFAADTSECPHTSWYDVHVARDV